MSRLDEEIALVRTAYPELVLHEDSLWALIREYPVPDGIWTAPMAEVAFQFPPNLPGQQPYGFWIRPGLGLLGGGVINNYTYPVTTPFGDGFGQFSWAPEIWAPKADVQAGTNMLDFVRSFSRRLEQGS
jgi:hypothetical protein